MKAEDIRMMGNRVLIQPVVEETVSGFIIPEQYRSFRTGIVKAVGNGPRMKNGERRPIPLNIGDAIVLSDDYRMPIQIEGKEHFIVSDEKVLCVLEKPKWVPAPIETGCYISDGSHDTLPIRENG